MARRVFRERALWLTRMPVGRIRKMALADLRRLDLGRLDVVELRAVYAALPAAFDADSHWRKSRLARGRAREAGSAAAARRQTMLRREGAAPGLRRLRCGRRALRSGRRGARRGGGALDDQPRVRAGRRAAARRNGSTRAVGSGVAPRRPAPFAARRRRSTLANGRRCAEPAPPPRPRPAMAGTLLAGLQAAGAGRAA